MATESDDGNVTSLDLDAIEERAGKEPPWLGGPDDETIARHAREDVPALVARVRELEAAIISALAEHDAIDRATPSFPDYPADRPVLEGLAPLVGIAL